MKLIAARVTVRTYGNNGAFNTHHETIECSSIRLCNKGTLSLFLEGYALKVYAPGYWMSYVPVYETPAEDKAIVENG